MLLKHSQFILCLLYFNKQLKEKQQGKMVYSQGAFNLTSSGKTLRGSAMVLGQRHLNLDIIEFIKGKFKKCQFDRYKPLFFYLCTQSSKSLICLVCVMKTWLAF